MKTARIIKTVFLLLQVQHFAQVDFHSSNLPIIIIDTFGNEILEASKITASMKIIYNEDGAVNNINDENYHYDGFIGIELRGSSTINFPKNQYSVETRDALGNNYNFPILGFPEENDWILYAPYSDKSLLRNVLAYHLYRKMGNYSSRTKFCEVILNNEYQGLYVLLERIKRDNNRVDISNLQPDDTSGVQLTGGYILQIDRDDPPGWYSGYPPFEGAVQRIYYQVVYPDQKDIDEKQLNYIQTYIENLENILAGENYDDIQNGFIGKINVDSFIEYLVLNELTKNVDAYRLSTYLSKDRDDKDPRIHFGPVWDYNIAFGNADFYRGEYRDGWQVDFQLPDNYLPPFWFEKLWKNDLIFNMFSARWDQLRKDFFNTNYIFDYLDEQISLISEAADRNFLKWPILGIYVWPNPRINYSFENEIVFLKNWIEGRVEWVNSRIDYTYSKAEWTNTGSVFIPGNELSINKDYFYSGLRLIDSIKFIPISNGINITENNDSLHISVFSDSTEYFLGLGYYQDKLLDVSPLYFTSNALTPVEEKELFPAFFSLYQNYPNPFNPSTAIEYSLPNLTSENFSYMSVKLIIYNMLGQTVATLVDEKQRPGNYKVYWNAAEYISGVYFYELRTETYSITRKMIFLK